jgi:hypothetical protein
MKKTATFGVLASSVLLGLTLAACSRDLPTAANGGDAVTLDRVVASKAGIRSQVQVFRAAGDIAPSVNAFRDALGTLNANLPGSRPDGRREINWDAVPAAFTNTNSFPGDFFNQPVAGRARGLVSSTPGTGQRVSDVNFADLNPDFGHEFVFFSPIRTFAPVGSNLLTVTFFVPGSNVAATSTGFGVVFSDVDRRGSTAIRLFDAEGKNLGRYLAPPSPGGLSFVGVMFLGASVARVEIESGQAAVSADAIDVSDRDRGPARDLVIMDDFIFGEPTAATGDRSLAPVVMDNGSSRLRSR